MNTDGRRALKILRERSWTIDDDEYRKWWEEKKAYYNSSAGSLWCRMGALRMANEWEMEHQ